MKTCLTLLITLSVSFQAHARLSRAWSYQELNDKATLIVIATPTKVTATSERSALPDILSVHSDGRKTVVMGAGVETSFEVLTVLKGERTTKKLVLHHYTLADPKEVTINGPQLLFRAEKQQAIFDIFTERIRRSVRRSFGTDRPGGCNQRTCRDANPMMRLNWIR